jgi:hypothetical protein
MFISGGFAGPDIVSYHPVAGFLSRSSPFKCPAAAHAALRKDFFASSCTALSVRMAAPFSVIPGLTRNPEVLSRSFSFLSPLKISAKRGDGRRVKKQVLSEARRAEFSWFTGGRHGLILHSRRMSLWKGAAALLGRAKKFEGARGEARN